MGISNLPGKKPSSYFLPHLQHQFSPSQLTKTTSFQIRPKILGVLFDASLFCTSCVESISKFCCLYIQIHPKSDSISPPPPSTVLSEQASFLDWMTASAQVSWSVLTLQKYVLSIASTDPLSSDVPAVSCLSQDNSSDPDDGQTDLVGFMDSTIRRLNHHVVLQYFFSFLFIF